MYRLVGSKPKTRKNYDKANLHRAYKATLSGMSVYMAARKYAVPESTLRDRTRGNVALDGVSGPDRILSSAEEQKLVDHIVYMANIGYGYTKANIQYMAADYAKSVGRQVQSESLSNNWFYSFMKHWPNLSISKPQKLQMLRAKSASKEVIDAYFKELHSILQSKNLVDKPERIYNIDETGVSTEHSPPKIVCRKNTTAQAVTSPRSSNVTIIARANAVGNHIPPMYVFPGKRWNDDLLSGAPIGSDGKMAETGWSNSDIFKYYITEHFAKHASVCEGSTQPTLVLYDGHKSHISLTLAEWASKRNVLFVLPPHTSHITQPLDLGVFGPLKSLYYKECQLYLQKNPGIHISKYDIAGLTARPYAKALCPENITAAFRKAGIHPFNRKAIESIHVAPSVIYCHQDEGNTGEEHNVSVSAVETEPNIEEAYSSVKSPTAIAKLLIREEAHTGMEHLTGDVECQPISVIQNATAQGSSVKDCTNNNVNIGKISVTVDTDDFFQKRKIIKVIKRPKKKFVPPFISGSLLNKANVETLQSHAEGMKRKEEKMKQKEKTKPRPNKKPKSSLPKSDVIASGSGITSRPISKECGFNPVHSDDDMDVDEDIAEEDKCCVCKEFQPEELRRCQQLFFVMWGKCDFCPHWTHLTYCTDVGVLRRDCIFRCPHCLPQQNG